MLPKLYRFTKFAVRSVRQKTGLYSYIQQFGYQDELPVYREDNMFVKKNLAFLQEPSFKAAYARGMEAADGKDFFCRWRVHILLWAARTAAKLPGDFVECGVAKGFFSSALMQDLNWDSLGKMFYLFDTYEGVSDKHLLPAERAIIGNVEDYNKLMQSTVYAENFALVEKNFSGWKNKKLVKGTVPETLSQVSIEKVAYLHIDMNCVIPEIEAMKHFWNKLVPGGIIVLDDYGHYGHELQLEAFNAWAKEAGTQICMLPTGQGLIIKTA